MVSKFLFSFSLLTFFLSKDKKKEVIEKAGIAIIKAVVLFKYGKANIEY